MSRLKQAGILVAAAFILFAPAIPQVFGFGQSYIRFWAMFSGVGQGIMKGTFTVTHADGQTENFSPLEVLELERYPNTFHYTFDRMLKSRSELPQIVEPFCQDQMPNGSHLSYSGKVGMAGGWGQLDAQDLCKKQNLLIAEAAYDAL